MICNFVLSVCFLYCRFLRFLACEEGVDLTPLLESISFFETLFVTSVNAAINWLIDEVGYVVVCSSFV